MLRFAKALADAPWLRCCHREAYLHYQALLASPRYLDQPTWAVEATAVAFWMEKRTVYRLLRNMQRAIKA